ncbi:PAS domain-containing protein [Geomicrobium sp. JCM 19055]|uniref:PAS domain-containing protein n=1 Tax=Geomicrobium sp. JCM 19055 TaxID=1460649 RepID=UPI0006946097|nr:PAS domain-containing protein [Geomicrobium sp. JCM 19055]
MQENLTSREQLSQGYLLSAIENSLAMIEFMPDGTITWVNNIFSKTVGYKEKDLCGMHHKKLCQKEFIHSDEYLKFWEKLRTGIQYQDKIKRVKKRW